MAAKEFNGTRVFVSKTFSANKSVSTGGAKPRRSAVEFRSKSCGSPASSNGSRRTNVSSPTKSYRNIRDGLPHTPVFVEDSHSQLSAVGDANRDIPYPLIYVSPNGTINVMLRDDVIIELTVDQTIRVLCSGKFSVASSNNGDSSCIMHKSARIHQAQTKVFAEFQHEKLAVFGAKGIIFTMKGLPLAYVVSAENRPNGFHSSTMPFQAVPAEQVTFPQLNTDFTLTLFYQNSLTGDAAVPMCEEMVRNAKYEFNQVTGVINVQIESVSIVQTANGDVEVNCKPRSISLSPRKGTVAIRTHFVDLEVGENHQAHIKRGVKRCHVSQSGMVVSDGNSIVSMDAAGHIIY